MCIRDRLLIVIPLGAPMFSVFQSSIGVILSTPDSYTGVNPRLTVGNGVYVSIFITFILFSIIISEETNSLTSPPHNSKII